MPFKKTSLFRDNFGGSQLILKIFAPQVRQVARSWKFLCAVRGAEKRPPGLGIPPMERWKVRGNLEWTHPPHQQKCPKNNSGLENDRNGDFWFGIEVKVSIHLVSKSLPPRLGGKMKPFWELCFKYVETTNYACLFWSFFKSFLSIMRFMTMKHQLPLFCGIFGWNLFPTIWSRYDFGLFPFPLLLANKGLARNP